MTKYFKSTDKERKACLLSKRKGKFKVTCIYDMGLWNKPIVHKGTYDNEEDAIRNIKLKGFKETTREKSLE